MQLVTSSRAYNFIIPPGILGTKSNPDLVGNCFFHFEVDIHFMMPTYRGGRWRLDEQLGP
jgi:hypothetical protein